MKEKKERPIKEKKPQRSEEKHKAKPKPEKPKRKPVRPPEKKVEKKKEPSPEEKLQKLHTDIKFALKVDNPDIEKCLQALDELSSVQVTTHILQKNADVIATLKKIRRYKASNAVMEKATAVYNKLKLQFIGKIETGKPKPNEKNQEEQDAQNTDDSKPVNGESEGERKDVSESESNSKPTDQDNPDENKSPNGIRPDPDEPADQLNDSTEADPTADTDVKEDSREQDEQMSSES